MLHHRVMDGQEYIEYTLYTLYTLKQGHCHLRKAFVECAHFDCLFFFFFSE